MIDAHTPRIPCLVYTGTGDNIFTLTPADGQVRQLTWSWDVKTVNETKPPPSVVHPTHAWPVWAPDGSRVACFAIRETQGAKLETRLYAIAADGVQSWELADLAGGMPIYGNWSPKADVFAMLVQRGERRLSLEVVPLAHPGQATVLVSGAPLFWSWSPRGDRLAVHVGSGQPTPTGARVLVLDVTSGQLVREVSHHPGEFRVPAWSPQDDLLAYVEQDEQGRSKLLLCDIETGESAPVAMVTGTTAALWSANGRFLAFGCASRPGSLTFSSVKGLDLASGKILPLLDQASAGFFWSPQAEALLYFSIDAQRSYLRWHYLHRTNGENTELVRFLPSREQTFVFSFFDQYAYSHPPVAPDGSALTFAGHLIADEPLDPATSSQIYVLPLVHTAPPRPVARGRFVCWNLG
jgi:WD40 repeat protein